MSLDDFLSLLIAFAKTADPQVVIMILVFSFVLLRSVWIPHGYQSANIAFVALVLAVPLTFVWSVADEVNWGGRFFWRASLQNGAAAVVAWYLIVPQLFQRWPSLLSDDLLAQHKKQLREGLAVVKKEEVKRKNGNGHAQEGNGAA